MKKTVMLTIGWLLFLSSCQPLASDKSQPAPAAFDEAAETEAILNVIEQETQCYFKRDYACWQDCYTHTDYAFQAWNTPDGSFEVKVGWKDLEEKTGKFLRDNPLPEGGSVYAKVERKNLQAHFFNENLAFLVWDQYHQDRDGTKFYHSKDTRIMEKMDGRWRIANVTAYWDYKNTIPANNLK